GGGDGELRLDEAQLELARSLADAASEPGMDCLQLGRDAEVALAVAFRPDHAAGRLVAELWIGSKLARHSDGLGRAAGMAVDENEIRVLHWRLLPTAQRVRSIRRMAWLISRSEGHYGGRTVAPSAAALAGGTGARLPWRRQWQGSAADGLRALPPEF